MAKIKSNDLIDLFETMARENWDYEWGAARNDCVDCSGAFVYAFRSLGKIALEHSSNYMARRSVEQLLPIDEARAGYACFLHRAQREDTPERWRDGKGDYYHVGLMGRDGRILNAQGTATGFVASSANGWSCCGKLKDVTYDEGVERVGNATVKTDGGRLNVRTGASTQSSIICKLDNGERVTVTEDTNVGWYKIKLDSGIGFASSAYIVRDSVEDAQEETSAGVTLDDIMRKLNEIEKLLTAVTTDEGDD